MAELRYTVVVRKGVENVDVRYHLAQDELPGNVRMFVEKYPGTIIEVAPEIPFEEIRPKREWYVYLPPPDKLVLSGYATEAEAEEEAERVRRELREIVEVLPRRNIRIQEYARTHPAWAAREGFAGGSLDSFGQTVSPRSVTEDVDIEVGGETTGTMARMKIFLTDTDRGRLADGREVVREKGRWVYRPIGAPVSGQKGGRPGDGDPELARAQDLVRRAYRR